MQGMGGRGVTLSAVCQRLCLAGSRPQHQLGWLRETNERPNTYSWFVRVFRL